MILILKQHEYIGNGKEPWLILQQFLGGKAMLLALLGGHFDC